MNSLIFSKIEPKQFYRKLEELFSDLTTAGSSRVFAARFANEFHNRFTDEFGVRRIIAIDVLNDIPEILYESGQVDISDNSFINNIGRFELPWIGEWATSFAALFPLDDHSEILIAVFFESTFVNEDPVSFSHLCSLISSLHYAVTQNLKMLKLQDAFDQAREIQMSLLPARQKEFASFDLAAVTIPAHLVGGDVFDFRALNNHTMYVMLADAAGHGLPAALQARDVIIGLRMAFELECDIKKITEKLNRIIHGSGLVSRIASLFLATLDSSGKFVYVNAGHPRPLLFNSEGIHEVIGSNMILGPNPDSSYSSSELILEPQSALLLYSDGLIEHSNKHGQEFGIDGLKQWMLDCHNQNASVALANLIERLQEFGHKHPFRDDATAIFISNRR